jgi:23S rRNA (guanosine2251-2'-O)-methyltransferase
VSLADNQKIPIFLKRKQYLSDIFKDVSHQGVAGVIREFNYVDFSQLLARAIDAGSNALLLAADHITDSGNLGALIRTAAFFGSDGLIIPRDRSAGITPAVMKRASGTLKKIPVARVTNLGRCWTHCQRRRGSGLWGLRQRLGKASMTLTGNARWF